MVDKKVNKKDVDVKPAAMAAPAAEKFTIVTISGETYRKYEDGRLMNTGA
tara:strand:- start:884 stop:1033 length:150 start_codon:yes stop_codon:yes gene_type:complete